MSEAVRPAIADVKTDANVVLLRRGATGDAVRALQSALITLGARTCADGYFGPKTERFVMDFQRSAGLPVDGLVTALTQAKIDEALRSRESMKHR